MFYAVTERFFWKNIYFYDYGPKHGNLDFPGFFHRKMGEKSRKKFFFSKKSLCHGVEVCETHNFAKRQEQKWRNARLIIRSVLKNLKSRKTQFSNNFCFFYR